MINQETVLVRPLRPIRKMSYDTRWINDCPGLTMPMPRAVLIDDDPVFLAIMKRSAQLEGIALDCFLSLEDLGYIGMFANYDVAILDFDLGMTDGIQISRSINALVKELPILIISAKDRSYECADSPECVKSVLKKSMGYQYILQVAARFCRGYE